MKRLFVSLPMKGKTDDKIQKGIREAYKEEFTLGFCTTTIWSSSERR